MEWGELVNELQDTAREGDAIVRVECDGQEFNIERVLRIESTGQLLIVVDPDPVIE